LKLKVEKTRLNLTPLGTIESINVIDIVFWEKCL